MSRYSPWTVARRVTPLRAGRFHCAAAGPPAQPRTKREENVGQRANLVTPEAPPLVVGGDGWVQLGGGASVRVRSLAFLVEEHSEVRRRSGSRPGNVLDAELRGGVLCSRKLVWC